MSGDAALDLEALALGVVGEQGRGALLAQGGLGEAPDLVAQGDELVAVAVDGRDGLALRGVGRRGEEPAHGKYEHQ